VNRFDAASIRAHCVSLVLGESLASDVRVWQVAPRIAWSLSILQPRPGTMMPQQPRHHVRPGVEQTPYSGFVAVRLSRRAHRGSALLRRSKRSPGRALLRSRQALRQALHLQMHGRSRVIGEGEIMAYWFLRNAVVVVFAIMIAGTLVTLK